MLQGQDNRSLGLAAAALAGISLLSACESAQTSYSVSSAGSGAVAAAAAPSATRSAVADAAALIHETSRFPDASPGGFEVVAEKPVSTFSIDVDTASYAVARRFLRENRLPPQAAVRVEEMVNYFPYAYPGPRAGGDPFAASVTVVPTPWNADTRIVHVGIKGFDIPRQQRPRANIVLLVDVSGSMSPADRLPLLKQTFSRFVSEMRDDDRIAIVTYASGTAVALEPTAGRERNRIRGVVEGLSAGGGTAGAEALQMAYALAERNFDKEAVNRIVLATDGDFNIGIADPKQLADYVATKRKTGVYLSILGVGLSNLNDNLMQKLAQAGNGNAAYIDSALEGRRVLGDAVSSTLFPIADDVKVQIEFNPSLVAEYRLIGYETRLLKRTDFKDDRVDAGEIGSGHSVTALYEIVPVGSPAIHTDPLRYGKPPAPAGNSEEIAHLRLRYKQPGGEASKLIEWPVGRTVTAWTAAAPDVRFSIAVSAFAQKLRRESALGGFSYAAIRDLAQEARGTDPDGYRAEFSQLVKIAETLDPLPLAGAK